MKVLYDYQIFSVQKFGGISRYFYEIMKGVDSEIFLIFNQNAYLEGKGLKIKRNFRIKTKIFNILNRLFTEVNLPLKKYDIFHPTYYNPYFIDRIDSPFVLTIHDMIHEKFPEYFSKNDKTSRWKRELAKKANRIIAVSHQTKQDIIDILDIPANKIDVVYHGSDFDLIKEDENFTNILPEKYILYTGNREHYKNFTNFIKASYKLLNNDNNLFILCAGGGTFNNKEIELFQKLKINRQLIQYQCNDEQLKSLYRNSLFFVFPSLYEGFGIPLLEAMACKIPILCSNISCFPEIVQNSALTFNPYSIEDMKQKLEFAVDNNLENYVENATKRFQEFSWDKARYETNLVYKKIYDIEH
jgi:glycosyltransferase involved in cell wall biosynthesis